VIQNSKGEARKLAGNLNSNREERELAEDLKLQQRSEGNSGKPQTPSAK
jgi:hypothetical protein